MTDAFSLAGPLTLTAARQAHWLRALQPLAPGLTAATAAAHTFVVADAPLSAVERGRLEEVLEGPPWVPSDVWAPFSVGGASAGNAIALVDESHRYSSWLWARDGSAGGARGALVLHRHLE